MTSTPHPPPSTISSPPKKIICFGDSLTSCGGENGRFSDILAERFPGHLFVNKGVGGDKLADALARLEADVLADRPDIVLVEFGANDWWHEERPPEAWAADIDAILGAVRGIGARPVLLGVFGPYLDDAGRRVEKEYGIDERAVAFRAMEAELARKHGCPYVPNIQERIIGRRICWLDRNHPNEYGNRCVADAVEPVLAGMLGAAPRPVRKPTLATIRDFWREAVASEPDRPAVVDGARRLTYGQADELVERVAANLVRLSGAARPKVAAFLPNCLEYYLLYWATVRLGGLVVPLNTWLKPDSLEGICRSVRPDVLVVKTPADRAPLEAAAVAPPRAVIALDPQGSTLTGWEALLADAPRPELAPIAPDDPAIVMHTSGTTAVPKGAVMRHSDLLFNVMTTINAHQFGRNDVHLLVNPMFHCTALYSSLPTAAYTRTPVIIASPTEPAKLMELVARERISTFLSVPTVFQQLLKVENLSGYNKSSLRLMAYAGSPMPVATIRALAESFPGVELHNFFGLTETISMTHVLTGEEAGERPDSIGRLLPFVEAKVVDEHDADLPAGGVGELLFARENVIPGYYNDPGRLAGSLVTIGGREWFRTGDLAMVDADGYFFIKGRKKDMIIVGGENVFAAEVEACLMAHPGVEEAAVKGAPATGAGAFLGEVVEAYVVRRDPALTAQALRKHCYDRLPSYKVPGRVFFLERLPRNPAGKVVKAELKG
ncbi:MAG TPA: AMP-binding protein [Planctomycetota bacterium]|nr:AMP-binding protein [Planctomycetota bacterium]